MEQGQEEEATEGKAGEMKAEPIAKLPAAIEAETEITEDDIDVAIAEWQAKMPPQYKDILEAEAA